MSAKKVSIEEPKLSASERLLKQNEDELQKKLAAWAPKTELGRMVQRSEVTEIGQIFENNYKILEPEIIDFMLPNLEETIVESTKTTRVRRSGRQFSFRTAVLVGDRNGLIGLGIGTDRERLPAMQKATENAKMNLMRINRGCGSWECRCSMQHSVPYKIEGRCASVRIVLMPAPKGTGLVVGEETKEVLKLAGITDVWSRTKGSTATKLNFVKATINALANISKVHVSDNMSRKLEVK
ncbi:MAG: 30S ribosomal protein S5 [Candidatus Diapherotrites archaeon]|uniref:Small ribosomal subunit protein uS5 n=1 Tax=Candidatus Iainarchaeum sp. TaxID=3101447 RepID=A0A8T4KTS2_9ARCH|nr:30S ribosomal protein S5 [Candidatus Diapherotrites archaeon]